MAVEVPASCHFKAFLAISVRLLHSTDTTSFLSVAAVSVH